VMCAGVGFSIFCLAVAAVIVILTVQKQISGEAAVGMFGALALVIQGCYKDYTHTKALAQATENGNGHTPAPVETLATPDNG